MSGSDVNMETLFRIASRRQTVCGGGGVYGGDRRRPVSVYIVSAIPRTEVSSDPATTLPWTVSGGDNVTPHCQDPAPSWEPSSSSCFSCLTPPRCVVDGKYILSNILNSRPRVKRIRISQMSSLCDIRINQR